MEKRGERELNAVREYARTWLTQQGREDLLGPEFVIMPGLCDVHVHLREPGFSHKETVRTGSLAAAAGGYTTVCAMPNLDPVPDCPENLAPQLEAIRRDARVRVLPYGALTRGEQGREPADLEGLAELVCAFSDDGRGVQDGGLMRELMVRAKALGKLICAHCEDDALRAGGQIHDGAYARAAGIPGIPSASEYAMLERDLRLAEETGCAYHACHLSARESIDLIRQAKKQGLDVSCETAPHYLLLCEEDLRDEGRFKMNPPLRSREDQQAVLEGFLEGDVDMCATDHAPHTAAEKAGGLRDSLMGVVGLEPAFPVLYTALVRTGIASPALLAQRMAFAPRARFGLAGGGDFAVFRTGAEFTLDPESFLSMGRATPFGGMRLHGRCELTVMEGRIVYDRLAGPGAPLGR